MLNQNGVTIVYTVTSDHDALGDFFSQSKHDAKDDGPSESTAAQRKQLS
jgi:hypothetical protein